MDSKKHRRPQIAKNTTPPKESAQKNVLAEEAREDTSLDYPGGPDDDFQEEEEEQEKPTVDDDGWIVLPDDYEDLSRYQELQRQNIATFNLPFGYIDSEGNVHRDFQVRKLTTRIQIGLGDQNVRNNIAKMATEALVGLVTRIGPYELKGDKKARQIIERMYAGDREYALWAAAVHSSRLGQKSIYKEKCPNCGGENEFDVEIEQFPVLGLKEGTGKVVGKDLLIDMDVDYAGKIFKSVWSYPNGYIQEKVFPFLKSNPLEGRVRILQRICREWDGKVTPTASVFEEMDVMLMDKIDEMLGERSFGVDNAVEVQCCECRDFFGMEVSFLDFLFPNLKKRGRRRSRT